MPDGAAGGRPDRSTPAAADPLALSPAEMRRIGYRTVDMLIDQITAAPDSPALRRATPDEIRERIPGVPDGVEFDELIERLERDVLPFRGRVDHPGYFAFIPGSGTFPAALGDLIASALNVYGGCWMEGAGPSRVELAVIDLFKEWIGYPEGALGLLVSGGSMANMTALACAREWRASPAPERSVVYVSDQAHSSLARAARVLGFRADQVHVLPTDAERRMRPDALAGAIAADLRARRTPLCVCVSAGSTNTGAVDPLAELAEIARGAGAWLHADAAYGGFAVLTERGRSCLEGLALADSVTLDPHKWLYQPFECGCVLVRDGERLRSAFEIAPDYLKDAEARAGEVNFSDLGLQLTRASRALKVWLSIGYFGVDAYRAAIDRALDLARHAEQIVAATPELELMSPAALGIVCFRRRFGDQTAEWQRARMNAALVSRFEESGIGLVSSTQLGGRYAIRMCVLNHTTGPGDVERTLRWFAEAAEPDVRDPSAARALSMAYRSLDVADGLVEGGDFEPAEIARLPLFASVSEAQVARVAAAGCERRVPAGETAAERWDGARDFFLIVDGEAEVLIDDRHVRDLGAGDFFGELAALDWGGGYGYVRTATVVASSDLRLLALSPPQLESLMAEVPALETAVRGAARERMESI